MAKDKGIVVKFGRPTKQRNEVDSKLNYNINTQRGGTTMICLAFSQQLLIKFQHLISVYNTSKNQSYMQHTKYE
jgi:hypothetical protein